MQANLTFLQAEEATALNCSKAWASLRKFESYFPSMTFGAELDEQYRTSRLQCVALSKESAGAVGLNQGIALDAILMLDRLMHQRQEAFSQVCQLSACFWLITRNSKTPLHVHSVLKYLQLCITACLSPQHMSSQEGSTLLPSA